MQTEPLQESFVAIHNTWVNIESIICVCAVWFCADRSSFLESNFSLGPIKFIQTCNFLSLLFGVFPPNKQLHRVNWQVSRWFVLPIMSCTLHMWSRFNTCGVWTELRGRSPPVSSCAQQGFPVRMDGWRGQKPEEAALYCTCSGLWSSFLLRWHCLFIRLSGEDNFLPSCLTGRTAFEIEMTRSTKQQLDEQHHAARTLGTDEGWTHAHTHAVLR